MEGSDSAILPLNLIPKHFLLLAKVVARPGNLKEPGWYRVLPSSARLALNLESNNWNQVTFDSIDPIIVFNLIFACIHEVSIERNCGARQSANLIR